MSDSTLFENLASDPFSFPQTDGGAQKNLTNIDLAALNVLGFAGNSSLFGTVTRDAGNPAGQVYELYQTILGRAPDAGGLEGYATQVANGTPIASIAQDMLTSGEYAADYGSSTQSDSGFIERLYVDGLHREPDAGGLATYENALASGVSRAQVAVDIATSTESQSDLAPIFQAGLFVPSASDQSIAQLYYGLLDRQPDPIGLSSYENYAAQGGSLSNIASDILGSAEFANVHGAPDNAGFVTDLYQGALGRQPDASGETHYLNALASGASRTQIALDISQSPEAIAHLTPIIQSTFKLA